MSELISELQAQIRRRNVILFAGSGVSAGLGAPTWGEFIAQIGKRLGFDPDVFNSMSASYLTLAEYYRLKMGSIGSLRSWMDKEWNVPDERILGSAVHQAIVELEFPIIYTTNYDSNIEAAYRLREKRIEKIVEVRDFLNCQAGVPQIIKLHGDFQDDSSIVLTETDYFDRLEFTSPLDIRLRSDVLARPILFIGYSLTDINVRLLLHKLWKLWDDGSYRKLQPRSYVFLTRPNPVEETVLERWGVRVIVGEHEDPTKSLATFLTQLVSDNSCK